MNSIYLIFIFQVDMEKVRKERDEAKQKDAEKVKPDVGTMIQKYRYAHQVSSDEDSDGSDSDFSDDDWDNWS